MILCLWKESTNFLETRLAALENTTRTSDFSTYYKSLLTRVSML